jgi:hypothetical protein
MTTLLKTLWLVIYWWGSIHPVLIRAVRDASCNDLQMRAATGRCGEPVSGIKRLTWESKRTTMRKIKAIVVLAGISDEKSWRLLCNEA